MVVVVVVKLVAVLRDVVAGGAVVSCGAWEVGQLYDVLHGSEIVYSRLSDAVQYTLPLNATNGSELFVCSASAQNEARTNDEEHPVMFMHIISVSGVV
jgi:hypothetical protein